MALRPEYSLGHSEFNEFLFAFVGEEKSGQQLTVLSALARLGLDPWGEAARLSDLPKEAATHALAAVIGKLPGGRWKASELQSIAVRLVNCLPGRDSPSAKSAQGRSTGDQKQKPGATKWLIWLALGAAVLFAMSRLEGDKVSEPDMSSVWSNQPHLAGIVSTGIVRPDRARGRFAALGVASEAVPERSLIVPYPECSST
jgi:hypothetical protein